MEITPTNFIEQAIVNDIKEGKVFGAVQTRHPPEPSGYLHIGHVRNIVLNYGTAQKFGGVCNLRYDDTNPLKEKQEFVDALQHTMTDPGQIIGKKTLYNFKKKRYYN